MSDSLRTRLQGSWELLSRIDRTAGGEQRVEPSLGSDPVAFLVFDRAGRFAAQFMKRDRTRVEDVAATQNNTRAQDGYDAYFGTFEVDERSGLVHTTLLAALSRDHVGKTLARKMSVEGDTLVIELDTTTPAGEPAKRTLTWRRVA